MLVADANTASLRFSHALVREVLVDGLTPLRRAQLHLQVADAIERNGVGNDDIERLADHLWHAAALGVGERAASALERAAEIAVGRVAYTTPRRSFAEPSNSAKPLGLPTVHSWLC